MMTNAQVFQIKNIFKTMLGVFTDFCVFFFKIDLNLSSK